MIAVGCRFLVRRMTAEHCDVLGRIVSPYTFEELEVIENPVEDGVMILSHLTRNLVQPGDYAFMVGNLEGHTR